MFEDRAAIGYDHGYDAQKFYLGLALDPKHSGGRRGTTLLTTARMQ
jgi:hypothetical protein